MPGESYSKMPVSVPATVDKSGAIPEALREVLRMYPCPFEHP
jgi:hypothetical protein